MRVRRVTKERQNADICAQMIEILHTQGIESAETWLRQVRKNDLYDHIEMQYLKHKKIVYVN